MWTNLLSGFLQCKKCHCNIPNKETDLLDHCKSCLSMERPNINYRHVCFVCDYHAYSKHDMLRHIRIHTGEKPYNCTWCPYKSKYPGDLRKHEKKYHIIWHENFDGVQSQKIFEYKFYSWIFLQSERIEHIKQVTMKLIYLFWQKVPFLCIFTKKFKKNCNKRLVFTLKCA